MQLLGSARLRTTAYHPITNGLIERFYRQLESALKAQPNPTRWTDTLPLVLLGIRTAIKTNIGCSTAELVYGTTLQLPGEFFCSTTHQTIPDPVSYVTRFKDAIQKLRAQPPCVQRPRSVHVSDDLSSCTHVFIRHDATRKSLQRPYCILSHADKHFTVDIGG